MRKVATVKNTLLLKTKKCLLFSWRDGSIFVSIRLEIHSSQVWSESICSRICSPLKQNRWREQVNNQHTHTQSTQRTISRHHHYCKNLSHNHSQTAKTLAKKGHDKDFEKNHTLNKSIPTFLTAQTPKPHICNATTGRFTIPWVFVTSGCHFI